MARSLCKNDLREEVIDGLCDQELLVSMYHTSLVKGTFAMVTPEGHATSSSNRLCDCLALR